MFEILRGDCRFMLELFVSDSSVDAIVTDPPYELGFMGKAWDATGVANDVNTWREALRVLKPGGHLLAFSGTRTYHRMVCAIEDAGFEIRDQIGWAYGSGFPKSHNGEWGGTALKPAWEPIVLARKPLIGTVEANWREHGTGALNIDGCRVEHDAASAEWVAKWSGDKGVQQGANRFGSIGTQLGGSTLGRWPANLIHDGSDEVLAAFPQAPGQLADASSSSSRKTQTVYGAMQRGSAGAPARQEIDKSAARFFYCAKASKRDRDEGLQGFVPVRRSDGRATEHHVPNLRTTERANHHPTVKPTDLMRYLCRLVTPPGGVVLDPFLGSGSTGKAAMLEGFKFIGVELSDEYADIAAARIAHAAYGDFA